MTFGWNYPPGVTGNEFKIVGADYEREVGGRCPECGLRGTLIERGFQGSAWMTCSECGMEKAIEPPEPDWDAIRDDREDRRTTQS
jgi:peptide subunit release factor 1 (eRF1)